MKQVAGELPDADLREFSEYLAMLVAWRSEGGPHRVAALLDAADTRWSEWKPEEEPPSPARS